MYPGPKTLSSKSFHEVPSGDLRFNNASGLAYPTFVLITGVSLERPAVEAEVSLAIPLIFQVRLKSTAHVTVEYLTLKDPGHAVERALREADEHQRRGGGGLTTWKDLHSVAVSSSEKEVLKLK